MNDPNWPTCTYIIGLDGLIERFMDDDLTDTYTVKPGLTTRRSLVEFCEPAISPNPTHYVVVDGDAEHEMVGWSQEVVSWLQLLV